MNHLINCSCGEVIVKALGSDTKIRAKILVFKDDAAFAVCKSCHAEVKVPLQINSELLKSMASNVEESVRHVPLYIRNFRGTVETS
jgi:hypothetical protein